MSDKASIIARHLLQIKAIKLSPQNPFTWASGIQSPIYCDNRTILSYPLVRNEVINCFVEASKDFEKFDIVAGVATAGIPHGALLADRLGLPFIYVREKPKSHGRQNQIEGYFEGNEKVLLIEDLISTGGSSLVAVDALRNAGCEVVGVLAIFTYQFPKAIKAFANAGCPFETLCTFEVLTEEALKGGFIQPEDVKLLQDFTQRVGA